MDKDTPVANQNTTAITIPQGMYIESGDGPVAKPMVIDEDTGREAVDPRKDVMDSIFENRNKQLQKELGIADEISKASIEDDRENDPAPEPAPADQPADKPQDAPPKEGEGESSSQAEPEPAKTAQAEKRTIIVNGQTMQVTEEELIRMAQQSAAAQQTWQDAARLRREAEHLYKQNTAPAQAVAAPSAPAAPASTEILSEAKSKEYATRLNYGSEEDQAKALRDLVADVTNATKQAPPTQAGLSQDQVIQAATTNALAIVEQRRVNQIISEEFKEVFQDNLLSHGAGILAAQLRQKYDMMGQPKPDLDIYREALGTVRDRYLKPSEPAQDNPAPTSHPSVQAAVNAVPMKERLERKRAAPQPPAAANKTASDSPPAKAPTASETVNWMRSKRHQPTY